MQPLVSVIVPVFNSGPHLKECVDSIFDQTYPNIEIIIVDDGSTDDCTDFLNQPTLSNKNLILIRQTNKGACAARNTGILNAKGDYIQFLDADDCLSPEKITNQIEILKFKDDSCVSFCEFEIFKELTNESKSLKFSVFRDFNSGVDLLLHLWNNQQFIANSSYLISKNLLSKAGNWDESLLINQDGEFFARVLIQSGKVYFEPEGRAFYRKAKGNNVSQQKSEKAFSSLLDSYISYERSILKYEDSERIKKVIMKVYLKFIYDCFPNYPHLLAKTKKQIEKLKVNEKILIGGPKFQLFTKIVGFENALRLKRFYQ